MITGQYVDRFADANLGMLEGASLNAPYEFHWLWVNAIEDGHIVCSTRERGGRVLRLPIESGPKRDRATATVKDPIFGPTQFHVAPFKGQTV